VRPGLVAVALLVLLAACGGTGRPSPAPDRDELVGTADVERLLVSTQKRKSPSLRVGTATCPDQVRLASGTMFTCTVQIEGVPAPTRSPSATSTPPAPAAVLTFAFKMTVIGLLLFLLRDTTAFDREAFALALVAGTVVYLAAEIRFAMRARIPYVVTDEKKAGPR